MLEGEDDDDAKELVIVTRHNSPLHEMAHNLMDASR
jgi:hypothetical protein